MAWSPEFCLSCDKFSNGYVFCSEECRLADLKKGQLNRGTSPTSLLTSLLSWPPNSGPRIPPSFRTVLPCQTLNKLRSNYNSASDCSAELKTPTQEEPSESPRSPGLMQAKDILKRYLQEKKALSSEEKSADSNSVTRDRSYVSARNNRSTKLPRKQRSEKLTLFHGVEPGSCGHCRELELNHNPCVGIDRKRQRPVPAESKPIQIQNAHDSSRAEMFQNTPLQEQISISPTKLSLTNSLKPNPSISSFDLPQTHVDRSMSKRSTSLPSLLPPLRLPPSFSPVDWEEIDMEGVEFSSVASEHMECGMLCKVGNGTLCVAGNYWG